MTTLKTLLAQLQAIAEKDPSALDKRVAVDTEARCDKAHLYEVDKAYGPDAQDETTDFTVITLHIYE